MSSSSSTTTAPIEPSTYIFLLWLGSSIVLMTGAVMFMRNQIWPTHRRAIAAESYEL